jgi:hypothetical protein
MIIRVVVRVRRFHFVNFITASIGSVSEAVFSSIAYSVEKEKLNISKG